MGAAAKVSNRQIRQAMNKQREYMEQHDAFLRNLAHDEFKTRGRVDAIETALDDIGRVAGVAHALATPRPTLWGRLRWLVARR